VDIYDVLGRRVGVLVDGFELTGGHEVDFDAANLSAGIYFFSLKVGQTAETGSVVLLK
jgi:hypothetical protein